MTPGPVQFAVVLALAHWSACVNVFLDFHLCQVNGTCTYNRFREDLVAVVTALRIGPSHLNTVVHQVQC